MFSLPKTLLAHALSNSNLVVNEILQGFAKLVGMESNSNPDIESQPHECKQFISPPHFAINLDLMNS